MQGNIFKFKNMGWRVFLSLKVIWKVLINFSMRSTVCCSGFLIREFLR